MKEMYIVRLNYNEERKKYKGFVNNEVLFCELYFYILF